MPHQHVSIEFERQHTPVLKLGGRPLHIAVAEALGWKANEDSNPPQSYVRAHRDPTWTWWGIDPETGIDEPIPRYDLDAGALCGLILRLKEGGKL